MLLNRKGDAEGLWKFLIDNLELSSVVNIFVGTAVFNIFTVEFRFESKSSWNECTDSWVGFLPNNIDNENEWEPACVYYYVFPLKR